MNKQVDVAIKELKLKIIRIVKENPDIDLKSLIEACSGEFGYHVNFHESFVVITCGQFGVEWRGQKT